MKVGRIGAIRDLLWQMPSDIDKETNALLMKGVDKHRQVAVGRRCKVSLGVAQFVIGHKVVRRVITPLAFEKTVGRRQEFDRVDAEARGSARNAARPAPANSWAESTHPPRRDVKERRRVSLGSLSDRLMAHAVGNS